LEENVLDGAFVTPTNPIYYNGLYKMQIDYLRIPMSQGGL
jgi:hypothetical protein